jgi:hypothetical protein
VSLLVFSTQDGHNGDRDLGRITGGDDDVGVRIDDVLTVLAAQKGAREDVLSRSSRASVLANEIAATARTLKLSVEGVLSFGGWSENVFISLDKPPGELGVHLLEHAAMVTRITHAG